MADLGNIVALKAAIAAILNNGVPDESIEPDDHNGLLVDLLDTITNGTIFQAPLVSGTNIKTVKGVSLVGAGDVAIDENATHTGEVAGATALTAQPTIISNKTAIAGALAGTEEVLVNEAGTLKKVSTQQIADLGGGGGTNIYNADGTLTGARTVTQAGFNLNFIGGVLGFGTSSPTATSRLHIKGQGSTSGTVSLLVQNDVGSNLFQVRDDGVLVLASNAYADISVSGTSWLLRSNAITDRTLVTVAANDKILVSDFDDSNILKQVTAQGIADLATNMYKADGTLISDRTIDIGTSFWKLRSTTSFTRAFIETSLANQYAELAFATPTGNIGFVEAFGASYANTYVANRFVVQSGSAASGMVLRSASTGGIKFAVGTGGDVNTYMNLTQSGLLLGNGIGASSPSARLHLIGDLRIDSQTATGATSGADTLPSNPVGFININLDGTSYKVPYYNV